MTYQFMGKVLCESFTDGSLVNTTIAQMAKKNYIPYKAR